MGKKRLRKLNLVDFILLGTVLVIIGLALLPGGLNRLFPDPNNAQPGVASSKNTPYFPADRGKSSAEILKTAPQTDLVKALRNLPEGPWEHRLKYQRDQYGQRWADEDGNGCDTRNDILARDLQNVKTKSGGCVVLSGSFTEPYTGDFITFRRGEKTSAAVQIDHVVALSNAWKTGAQSWDRRRRQRFANDPLNLLAVDGPSNKAKGDADAAYWLPANRGFHCQYVALQVAIKQKWKLWVTPEEKKTMAQVASVCPQQSLPTGGIPTN